MNRGRHACALGVLWLAAGAARTQTAPADAPVLRIDGDVRQVLTLGVAQLRALLERAVLAERDGQPLADSEGPLTVEVPGDLRSGPRHVMWVQRIEVRVLRD